MSVHPECPTCSCTTQVGTYCDASIDIEHENFACLEWLDHEGPHKSSIVDPFAACPACGRFEEHSDTCWLFSVKAMAFPAWPDHATAAEEQTDRFCEVQWSDGDEYASFVPLAPTPLPLVPVTIGAEPF